MDQLQQHGRIDAPLWGHVTTQQPSDEGCEDGAYLLPCGGTEVLDGFFQPFGLGREDRSELAVEVIHEGCHGGFDLIEVVHGLSAHR